MKDKPYYSQRQGRKQIDLYELKKLFLSIYEYFFDNVYFMQYIGWKEDRGIGYDYFEGSLGSEYDIERILFHEVRKRLWPISQYVENYSEEDLFDIIEFCYRYVSKPIYPSEGNVQYDPKPAQDKFRTTVNSHLKDYKDGFEIDVDGDIKAFTGYGLEKILYVDIPSDDQEDVVKPVVNAVKKYRNRHSSNEDRKEAVRELADVLEYLRPQAKKVITKKDDADLFNIANNYGIRHHNEIQNSDYNKGVWHTWMFYFYLATIHAVLRLIEDK